MHWLLMRCSSFLLESSCIPYGYQAALEKQVKSLEAQLGELQAHISEKERDIGDFNNAKSRLGQENADLQRQLEEAESHVGSLTKAKQQLAHQLEEANR